MYFKNGGLVPGPKTVVSLNIIPADFTNFEMGFTRGYMSSQAYATLFKNAPYRPADTSKLFYDTAPYAKQYEWLGAHARKMVFEFLQEAIDNNAYSLDLFAYDLDEPDFVTGLQKLGSRLRAFLDDATLHTKSTAREPQAKAALIDSAGQENVMTGHFQRFAHSKVMILKNETGTPIKVLTGSANFSVRGLYVQANNVLIFTDPKVADLYEEAFQQAFTDMSGFANSQIAEQWWDIQDAGVPPFSVCFSPHTSPDISLSKAADAINKADSSVLYAIMELAGSGAVMDSVKALGTKQGIFSYGVTQTTTGLNLYKPGAANGILVPFSFLSKQVPPPFDQEVSGGMGQVIHDKFVVVDFNDTTPVVFTGSSNLAAGGETQNGDNLLAIYDEGVVTAYAVEAIRLIDHFHFRAAMSTATDDNPLALSQSDWWNPYYDENDIRCRERVLFIR
jgi:phosphatidylserine/phosphatidylglycerophosphate/cardiolipin synthase-like enzyme